MSPGVQELVDAIRAAQARAEFAFDVANSALAEAEALLEGARSVGVSEATDEVELLVLEIEAVGERLRPIAPALEQLLATVESWYRSGLVDRGPSPAGQVPPEHGLDVPRLVRPVRTNGLTLPSRKPDSSAVPGGTPETAPRAGRSKQSALEWQRRSGKQLAEAGYRINYLAEVPDRVSPDFMIEDRIFDCFTPEAATSVESIRRTLRGKMDRKQADRFVVNLDRSVHDAEDLRRHLRRTASTRLREVIIIKGGAIEWVWP